MGEKNEEDEVTLVSRLESRKPLYTITGKPPKIETSADRLYEMVKQKGSVRLSEAAKELGVSEETVIKWGEILEEHRMIELHYPMAGKPRLGIIKPKLRRGVKEKKEKKPGIPKKRRFTKKVIFIYLEIIALGELLIYIFLINRYLSMNFLPTVRFHFDGFVTYLTNLINVLLAGNFSAFAQVLLMHPMYLGFLIILIVIIILIILLIIKSRKPKLYMKEEKRPEKKEEKKEEKKPEKKEEKREGKKEEHRKAKREEKKGEKEEDKKDAVFADIIRRYKERLKEIEK
jgi:Na+-transporting methylmalonyl-CoA/oxaloacetate decarboxylase gamma subunit